jgi:hypothetical protein
VRAHIGPGPRHCSVAISDARIDGDVPLAGAVGLDQPDVVGAVGGNQLAVRPPVRQLVLDSGVVGELPVVPAPPVRGPQLGDRSLRIAAQEDDAPAAADTLPRMSNAMP